MDLRLSKPTNYGHKAPNLKVIKDKHEAIDDESDYIGIDHILLYVPTCIASSPETEFKCKIWKWRCRCLCYCGSEDLPRSTSKVANSNKNHQRSSSWDFLKTSQQGETNKSLSIQKLP